MAVPRRSKLIVGLDYGTTYSGIAFVHSTAADFQDIKAFTAWPGGPRENNEHLEKAPSVYAYARENREELEQDAWGYQVDAGMTSYSWTKLLLDKKALQSSGDDPGLKDAIATGYLKLPRGKAAVDVVSDYLRGIYTMFTNTIIEKLGSPDILAVTPIEFWLTVPAIWSDEAKAATKTAAQKAGFGSREEDEIYLISEPEAAAHLALKSSVRKVHDLVKANTGILVCDCGGGTVDITSYTITQTEPRLVLEESSTGTGGKCGATYIDRNLHALLKKRFGKPFTNLPPERIGPGSRFMNGFEGKKKDFSMNNMRKTFKLQLKIPEFETANGPRIAGYDKSYAEVILSEQDLRECFDPVVEKILALVEAQVTSVSKSGQPEVSTIILVGGLGNSPYVKEKLQMWCAERQIRMVTPWSGAWSAVVCGAVLQGLEGSLVYKKMARRHYGIEMSRDFKEGVDARSGDRWATNFVDQFTDRLMISEHMAWIVSKGSTFDEKTEMVAPCSLTHHEDSPKTTRFALFSCAVDEAPEWCKHPRVESVGQMIVNYEHIDLTKHQSRTVKGKQVYQISLAVNVKLGAKAGVLTFRTMSLGEEVGTASIDFSHT